MVTIDLFKDIYGEKRVTETLTRSILNNKTHHAYLLNGKVGTGRKAVAYEFMKITNCSNRDSEGGYCGECRECRSLKSMQSENIQVILPERAELTNQEITRFKDELVESGEKCGYFSFTPNGRFITIGKIKSIKDFTNLSSIDGRSKFVLIDMAERMNKEAQNSLLKILEEPPKGFYFFLVTENKEQLLPTILSRCSCIEFTPVEKRELKRYLRDNDLDMDDRAIELAKGSIANIQYLSSEKGQELISKVKEYIAILEGTTPPETIIALDQFPISKKGEKFDQDFIIDILSETITILSKQFIIDGKIPLAESYTRLTNNLIVMLKRNINPRLLFLNHYLSFREEKKVVQQ